MRILNSIKTKVSLFLIFFSIVLIFSLLGYMYWYGRQNIINQSEKALSIYSNLLNDDLETQLNNSVYELTGLIFQLDHISVQHYPQAENAINYLFPLEKFITGYAPKYSEMILFNPHWESYIELRPVIVYGGERKPQKSIRKTKDLAGFLKTNLQKPLTKALILGPDYSTSGESVYILLPYGKQKKNVLIASISFNYFTDKIFNTLNLPDSYQAEIADNQGIVLYATDDEKKLKNVENIIKESELNFISEMKGQIRFIDNRLVSINRISKPLITLILKKNLDREIADFNFILLRMLGFSIILLLLVVLLVRILSGRLTQIFHEVTQTADRLAVGDFSKKINIQRQDELGLLISAFNRMVDELRQSYQKLETVNEELRFKINELNQTKTELSQKEHLALIGETVSKISHEIQNKIGGVSVWVQNLEIFTENNETIEEYILEIKSALNSFMEMLANFKRFYREPELKLSEFEIREFIDSIVKQYANQAISNQVELKIICENNCGMILADKEHLEKVLANLILNAIFYAPQSSEIIIESYLKEDWLFLSVTDQGPGIKDDIVDKIFQPFFTTKASGSGLGLAMVHSIVTAHLGKISFKNNTNGGACFTIKLPIKPISTVNELSE